ncbi:high mobility group B protein 1-like [Salvia splendens]|uniref:high mobility group B protein 1-like n=1 Tax=Salvia splendens TaxID=180675 RepID=UPI001C27F107|nr:high mobility group B protein 1-like [Salvia splendens]
MILGWDDFRKSFKEANPDYKKVATVAKEGGEKWKALSDDVSKNFISVSCGELVRRRYILIELKAEYQKASEAENEQDDSDSTENEAKDESNDSYEKEIKVEKDDITEEDVKEEEIEDDE